MRKIAVNLNGITIAYVMGLTNAMLVCVMAFGVHLNDLQRSAVAGMVNAALVLAIHLAHRIGEAAASGQSHVVGQAKMDQAMQAAKGE